MADKLISLKRSAEDKRKDMGNPAPIEAMAPDYPWGTCLDLGSDELKKLGFTKLPAIGAELTLTAKVRVTRISESAAEGSAGIEDQRSMSLQITDAAIS